MGLEFSHHFRFGFAGERPGPPNRIPAPSRLNFTSTVTLCELFHKTGTLSAARLEAHRVLSELYSASTAAVAPGPALARRLQALPSDPGSPICIIALGKAALPMANTAVEMLRGQARHLAGGIVVGPAPASTPDPALLYLAGDHPEPGPGSFAAAEALAGITRGISGEDEVWVLLSGGTTSLIGAPEAGISPAELSAIYSLLLGSGLDITAMNRIRKRFSRWGGGKLARAVAPARLRMYVVSDVIGDDLASIGSGPCVPDPTTAGEVHQMLETAGLWRRIPDSARRLVVAMEAGEIPETPKPGDRIFDRVTAELIASNRLALDAAAKRARELGLTPEVVDLPLSGEASAAGAAVAATVLECAQRSDSPKGSGAPDCLIWGGETTVTLGDNVGVGGRCQELALAAAKTLEGGPENLTLLAAGTDGRDGPTDAAGAIVDNQTWRAIVKAGRNPARDLEAHNAYPALDAAGALLRPGLTGTNVMDVVIGLCWEG